MQFVKTPKCNHRFGAPLGMTEEQVGTLHVQIVRDAEVGQGFKSFWRPSQQEIQDLLDGGYVTLTVYGSGHPVVSMEVEP